jgi:hypothetical protein
MDPRYKSPTANVDRDESEEFRDIEQFTHVLKWMLRVGAALAVIGFVSAAMQFNLLSRVYTEAEGRINDLRIGAVGGVASLLSLATFVIFGRWIVLAHRNLPALGSSFIEVTPGWAVGWFFIPLGNLWKPYQAMRFLWQASRDARNPSGQDTSWVLPLWWTLWLISQFLGNIAFQTSYRDHTIAGLKIATGLQLADSLLGIPLYLVAALMVTRIWEAQRKQHENPREFAATPGFADAAG